MKTNTYTPLKVNNEIALCEFSLCSQKEIIQRMLLKHHISYYIKWHYSGIFRKKHESCIVYINLNDLEVAQNALKSLGTDFTSQINFIKSELPKRYY